MMDSFLNELKTRLAKKLTAVNVEIRDFSAEHAGHQHGGLDPHAQGGTHLEIRVLSERFTGLGRLNRERLIHEVLAPELQSGRVHALVLVLKSPSDEPSR